MVSSTTFNMVSTLAGLKRLEAQIQKALAESHPSRQSIDKVREAASVQQEAHHAEARANTILSTLDVVA